MCHVRNAAALVVLVLPICGCGQKAEPAAPMAPGAAEQATPETVVATAAPYRDVVNLPGASVTGYETTQVRAKVGGYVKHIGKVGDEFIDIGTVVEAGTLLAELDIPETADVLNEKRALLEQARSAVAQAQANVAEAKTETRQRQAELEEVQAQRAEREALLALNQKKLKRLQDLARTGAIGGEALDEVEFAVAAARASLGSLTASEKAAQAGIESARARVMRFEADVKAAEAEVRVAEAGVERILTLMDYAKIRAPFAGVIVRRLVDHGSFVQPAENNSAATALFEITRVDRVRVVVGVPSSRVARIAQGQPVQLHGIGGLPGRSFAGQLSRMSATLDEQSRTLRVEADFENPVTDINSGETLQLRPGMFGTLTVVSREWSAVEPLAVVPTAAVGTDAQGRKFVVVVADGKKSKRIVEVAFNDAISVGIASGLEPGEEVSLGGLSDFE